MRVKATKKTNKKIEKNNQAAGVEPANGKEAKVVDIKAEIRKLLKRGREQGFVTQEDVLAIFTKPEDFVNEVDDLYHKFLDEGIDVFDTTEIDVSDVTKSAGELEKELESLTTLEVGYLSDPVRMYLR